MANETQSDEKAENRRGWALGRRGRRQTGLAGRRGTEAAGWGWESCGCFSVQSELPFMCNALMVLLLRWKNNKAAPSLLRLVELFTLPCLQESSGPSWALPEPGGQPCCAPSFTAPLAAVAPSGIWRRQGGSRQRAWV